jgi:hypothetical protein
MALVVCLFDSGMTDQTLLEDANRHFEAGVQASRGSEAARPWFRTAAEDYDRLQSRGYRSPVLFRNQGNAYWLAGDLPRAILSYRRGLHLAPRDRQLLTALELARDQVAYGEGPSLRPARADGWLAWLPLPACQYCTRQLLFWCALASYSVFWVGLSRWWMVRDRGWLITTGAALLSSSLFAGALALDLAQERDRDHHPVVVIARDGIALRKGNGRSYPLRREALLNAGVEGDLIFERGPWLQIRLADGTMGWVTRADALLDEQILAAAE